MMKEKPFDSLNRYKAILKTVQKFILFFSMFISVRAFNAIALGRQALLSFKKNSRITILRSSIVADSVFDENEILTGTELNKYSHPLIDISKKASLSSILNSPSIFSMSRRPQVVGHRGVLYMEPENTIRGFQRSSEIGCDAVELDVFLLKCGTLIAFHGGGSDENPGSLLGYCGVEGNILDYSYEEVRKLTFKGQDYACPLQKLDHAFIPTLKEVLEDAKLSGLTLKIELKGPGTPDAVLQLVEESDMVDQCHFSSFDLKRIARIRQLRPSKNYITGALFKDNLPYNFIDLALQAGASQIHLKYNTCTVERIAEIHRNGMDSMAWFSGPKGMKHESENYSDVGNEDYSMYWTVLTTGVRSLCVNKPNVLIHLLDQIEDAA